MAADGAEPRATTSGKMGHPNSLEPRAAVLGHVVRHVFHDAAPQKCPAVFGADEITIEALSWIALLSVAAALLLRESLTCLLPISAARNLAEQKGA